VSFGVPGVGFSSQRENSEFFSARIHTHSNTPEKIHQNVDTFQENWRKLKEI
jgi:hypothetical protein